MMNPVTEIWLTFLLVQLPTIGTGIYFACTAHKRSLRKTIWLSFGFVFGGIVLALLLMLLILHNLKPQPLI